MKKILLSIATSLITLISLAQNNINGYEYWFDNDFAGKKTMSLTPTQQLTVNQLVSTSGLTSGIHTFNFRSFDNNGVYSSVASSFFYKTSAISTNPNPTVVAYQYWLDNDYANAVTVNTPAQQQVNINSLISMSAVSNGVHTFNIRFKDNLNVWSSVASSFFYKISSINNNPNPTVVAYQYWLDNDYASAVTVNTPAQQQVNINSLISMSAVSNGVHTFNIRFKDNLNVWSSVASSFFYKISSINNNPNPTVSAYQYWLDNDYANAVTVNTPAQQQININSLISMSSVSNGVHTFNIRFKDNLNVWSSVASSFFYKTSAISTNSNPTVAAYQYWLDNDYANAVTVNTPVQQQVNINSLISISSVSNGVHTFNIRFKDNLNVWSSVASSFFYKSAQQTVVQNQVVGYRYWFDNDFANAVYSPIIANQQVNVMDNLNMTHIPKGMHQIHFQFKDTLQQWSVVVIDSVEKISLPIANFAYTPQASCDSTLVQFSDLSIDGDTYFWDFGDEATDTIANPTHSYYTPGSYQVSLTVTDTLTGADSTYQTSLFVTGNTAHSFAVIACKNYTSPSGNFVYTTSGTYCDTIPNQWDCDSLLIIDLTINTVNTDVTQELTILTAKATGATYQWLDCDNGFAEIQGETNQSFTATQNGNYAVEITQNGCIDTSACYAITTIGILENNFDTEITVYPNPTDGLLKIDLGKVFNEFSISINDVNGKLLSKSFYKQTKVFEINLNIHQGIYLLTINSGNKKATIRIIKNDVSNKF